MIYHFITLVIGMLFGLSIGFIVFRPDRSWMEHKIRMEVRRQIRKLKKRGNR